MKNAIRIICVCLLAACSLQAQNEVYLGEKGVVSFTSDAPLEIIKAESHALKGVIDPESKSFALTLNIGSFQGFNSDIQRVHFLENYMEQKKYPNATFKGKIIEDVPFDVPGTYTVRAKGDLEIHGITKERIIKGTLTIKPGSAHVLTSFSVPVADHGITIPRIVNQKIAEQIAVSVNIELLQSSKS